MIPELSPWAVAALAAVAFVAGVVDAIGGGGGLLTVPALLTAGLPPHLVFGTNKGASVFGSASALVRFARAGLVDRRRAALLFPLSVAGSLSGASLLLWLEPDVLRPVVLALLVMAAVVVATVRPRPGTMPVARAGAKAAALALGVGAYDGFFGPGTGTFLIIGFVLLLHDSLSSASANAKVVNLASNAAALGLFIASGTVVWKVALPMAVGQLLGGALGAQLTILRGDRVVRRVVLVVVVALVVKLARDWAVEWGAPG